MSELLMNYQLPWSIIASLTGWFIIGMIIANIAVGAISGIIKMTRK